MTQQVSSQKQVWLTDSESTRPFLPTNLALFQYAARLEARNKSKDLEPLLKMFHCLQNLYLAKSQTSADILATATASKTGTN